MSQKPLRDVLTPPIKRLLVGIGFNSLGNGLTLSLLMVYLITIRDIPETQATLLLTWMAIIGLALTPMVGAIVDRIGPRPVLLTGLVVEASGVASWAYVESYTEALISATIVAAGGSSIWAPQSAIMARLAPSEDRQQVFGLNFMLLNAGLGLGGMVGALLVRDGVAETFERLYLVNAATYVFGFLVVLSLTSVRGREIQELTEEQEAHGYAEVFRDRRVIRLIAGSLVLLACGYASVEAGMSIFTTLHVGLSAQTLGIIYGVNTFTIVALQPLMLKYIHRKSRIRLMSFVGVLWAVSWLITGSAMFFETAAVAVFVLCIAQLIFAVGETLWSPVVPSLTNDMAPAHLRGRYNALLSLQWSISSAIGPIVVSVTLARGEVSTWIAVLFVGALVASAMLLSLRSRLTPFEDGTAELVGDSARE